MSSVVTLSIYSLLVLLASLAGGWIPLFVRLTHERMQLAISFVAGAMLGVGVLHLVPHALVELQSIDQVVWYLLAGFLAMFFVERFFAFHHHDAPSANDDCADHGHDHAHHAADHAGLAARPMRWSGAAIGMALHSLADGVALAASVQAEEEMAASGTLAGLATFFVIFLHKPFDAMTIGTLLAAGGRSRRMRHLVNATFALAIPLGVMLFELGLSASGAEPDWLLGAALAFSAGMFICISSSDLLPELQFHSHDRVKLSVALLVGLAVAWGVGLFEGHGHDHGLNQHSEHQETIGHHESADH